ncbi:MAG: 2-C-methyl-D-erythritol 4-phosphate cytidylyltransferase [Kiritimatiellae bacterium]|nr:2-C-methyl-D-erythritol 4-phosphate cytidylyltransferase [Kiritimatiellia bacterium]
MTVALIIAGGMGSRMGAVVPKQFVQVNGKPVLMYTLEAFQRHSMVDVIELVCIDGWQDAVRAWAEELGITKLKWVVAGGATGQESIRNGVYALEDKCGAEDIVIVHDGIRPLVDEAVLDDVIDKARQHGNGVTSMPYNEQIFLVDPEQPETTCRYIPRETLRRVATPQAYRFDLLSSKYHEAFEKGVGIHGSSYTNTMMTELGVRLFFAAGSDRNIKLTTPGDIEIFKAMLG